MTNCACHQKDNYRKLDCPKYNSRTSKSHEVCKYNMQWKNNYFILYYNRKFLDKNI